MTQSNHPQNSPSERPRAEEAKGEAAEAAPETVDPRDLVYNAGTVDNPEELLDRPNVTPQTLDDNERAM